MPVFSLQCFQRNGWNHRGVNFFSPSTKFYYPLGWEGNWKKPSSCTVYTCIKTWKIMYKIRLQKYFFETCNKWANWQGFSVDIRILSIKGCLPLPRGYIHVEKHYKMCIKSEFKEICLKLATNVWSDKSFLLTSKVCPQGVFCPCPGAIFMYKIVKNVSLIIILKLATYGQREKAFLLSSKICPQEVVCPCPGAIYMYKII